MKRIKVARLDQLAVGSGAVAAIGSVQIAIFNVDGRIFAIDDWCLRCGSSLASGTLRGAMVRCVDCGWQYDVQTGSVNGVPALRIDTFSAKVLRCDVVVEIPSSWCVKEK